ncbi:hypothetical protein HYH02_007050 [Chlamydomonas schloesseri]|uniref:Uncharacterized protein n=1 Tax=Chlamydomonas schloesseri TaxID=2026947 RepID=A0A835WII9_9CHLO|nr:hypothetical protein HYH02_007050 [Chlamydomonas schloesseri]|eukprot:KAG2448022.1 hypothetical protein HYH02_007050 [Chlamydomonas schloesseri]
MDDDDVTPREAVAAVLFDPGLVENIFDSFNPGREWQNNARNFRACCQGARNALDKQLTELSFRRREDIADDEQAGILHRLLRRGGRPNFIDICDFGDSTYDYAVLAQKVLQAFVDVAAEQPHSDIAGVTTKLRLRAASLTPDVGRAAAAALPALSKLLLLGCGSKDAWETAVQGLEALLQGAHQGGSDGAVAGQLHELGIDYLEEATALPPQPLAGLAACSSLRSLVVGWDSAPRELLRQLGSLTQLHRLSIGTIPFRQVSELRPLTNLTKLTIARPAGIASAADFAGLPALRYLGLGCGLMDVRGLDALTSLTSLEVGMLLGPEHVAALPADQDCWQLGSKLADTGGGLLGALPPLRLPLPSYPLPPKLAQLRFCFAAQFVEVLGALTPPDSLQHIIACDGNGNFDYLQPVLLHGRHTTAGADEGGGGGAAADQWPALLPAAAQAVARFTQQLGSRWRKCRDVRVTYVAPPPAGWQPVQMASVLLPPPAGWNLPEGPRERGLQEAPGSHGAWVSALAAMPGLGGLWLQGLALTAADLQTIGTAFTGIRTLSLLGVNPRCCPFPALLALGPLLPTLRRLRLAGDPLLISPEVEDMEERERAAAKWGVVACALATLRSFGGVAIPSPDPCAATNSSSSTARALLGLTGAVTLVCGCDTPGGWSEEGGAALQLLHQGVLDGLDAVEAAAGGAGGGGLAAGAGPAVEWVGPLDVQEDESLAVRMNNHGVVPEWDEDE